MAERPEDKPTVTPGDPLAGDEPSGRRESGPPAPDAPTAPQPRDDAESGWTPPSEQATVQGPVPPSERPVAERPPRAAPAFPASRDEGYGPASPAPPGAGGTARTFSTTPGAGQYVLSGWWRRAGALIIDGLVVGAGATVILLVIGAIFSVGFAGGETAGTVSVIVGLLLGSIAVAVVALLYAPFLMNRTDGQTFGKMATGIRVVRANGEPMTFAYATLREVVVKALLFGVLGALTFGLAQILDYLWPLWDEENRALHDMIVDSRVVLAS